jgi:hypothetical protein
MIWTTPWRRITLHFSHIGLTDGLTFIVPSGSDFFAQRLPGSEHPSHRGVARAVVRPDRFERDRGW